MSLRQVLYSFVHILPTGLSKPLVRQYRRCRDSLLLMRAARYDRVSFARHSGLFTTDSRNRLEARLIKNYHRLEKGLALPQPRPGFGKSVAEEVLDDMAEYVRAFGPDRTTTVAFRTLSEYAGFLESAGLSTEWLRNRMAAIPSCTQPCGDAAGGTREVERSELQKTLPADVSLFMQSRHSVRQFAPGQVDIALISKAVRAAQFAPSVCNRQSGHVFVVNDPGKRRSLLQLQNGNSGFGEQCGALLIVTSSLESFLTVGERYQCWIDGGLFGMCLLHALHGLGLGACALNWSVEPDVDRRFKTLSGVPESHRIMFLVAVGHLLPRFRVAASERRELADVLHVIE